MGSGASSPASDDALLAAVNEYWRTIPEEDRAGVLLTIQDWLASLVQQPANGSSKLKVHLVRATDLSNTDRGASDPYVLFTVGSAEVRSSTVRNSLNPSWGEDLELELPQAGASDTLRLHAEVWDQDSSSTRRYDDSLGYVEIDLGSNGGHSGRSTFDLEGARRGVDSSLTFSWTVESTAKTPAPADSAETAAAAVSFYVAQMPDAWHTQVYSAIAEYLSQFAVADPPTPAEAVTIVVRIHSATNLADADWSGLSDPYATVSVGGSEPKRTETKGETLDPVWDVSFEFELAGGARGEIVVDVHDKSNWGMDNALGRVTVPLEGKGMALRTFPLAAPPNGERAAQGSLTLSWRVLGDPEEDARAAEEARKANEERRAAEAEARKAEDEKRRAEQEKNRNERLAEEERRRAAAEEERRAAAEAAAKAAEEQAERERAEAAAREAEENARRARAEAEAAERRRAEAEEAANAAAARAEAERQKAREAERRRREFEAKMAEGEPALRVTIYRAEGLRNADRGFSDPFVVATLGESTTLSTSVVRNTLDPVWGARASRDEGERLTFENATLQGGPVQLKLEVLDDDNGKPEDNDPLGEVVLTLLPGDLGSEPGRVTLPLTGEGAKEDSTITIEWRKIVLPKPATARPVIRREIRTLSASDTARYVAALKYLMRNERNKTGSSEYARVAGYHGYPGERDFGKVLCAHRNEAFPAWHRAYLCEMEWALQKADRALGNDGRIALPYWDWLRPELNGQVLPGFIREHFAEAPRGLIPTGKKARNGRDDHWIYSEGFSGVNDERTLLRELQSAELVDLVQGTLHQPLHYVAASKLHGGQGEDIESPHDKVHRAVGGPMGSLHFAAFHPVFWLHHCNVDRVYEAYLRYHPDSRGEFETHQARESRSSRRRTGYRTNKFTSELTPFKNEKAEGAPAFTAPQTFVPKEIGYEYDALPRRRPQQIRELPTLVLFRDVNFNELVSNAYTLYVFVVPLGEAGPSATATLPPAENDACAKYFAGTAAIFGGVGAAGGCENCEEYPLANVTCDVTRALGRLGRSQYDVRAVVFARDERGKVCAVEEVAAIPKPELVGPFWASNDDALSEEQTAAGASDTQKAETKRLQLYLERYGYEPGEADSEFGPKTAAAVRRFQEQAGLATDGIVGKFTKETITLPRNDGYGDQGAKAGEDRASYEPGATVRYWVGLAPAYLDRAGVEKEIAACFKQPVKLGTFICADLPYMH